MNRVSNAIKCVNCKCVLQTPVLLPCSHSICKKHTTDSSKGVIFCNKCGLEHSIPRLSSTNTEGFPLNEALAEIIESRILDPYFSKERRQTNESCEKLDEALTILEQMLKDPLYFTHEVIASLKDVIQLKGEEVKLKIDKKMANLLDKLEKCDQDCKNALKSSEYVRNLAKIEQENVAILGKWLKTLDEINFNEFDGKRIKSESERVIESLESKLLQIKLDLLHLTQFDKFKADIEEEFGAFEINNSVIEFIFK